MYLVCELFCFLDCPMVSNVRTGLTISVTFIEHNTSMKIVFFTV